MKKQIIGLGLGIGLIGTLAFAQNASAATNMLRLYNPYSGEHLYTASVSEKDNLVSLGWNYEGTAWIAPDSGDNVYRLYNPNSGDHHYTMSWTETTFLTSIGWNYEGVGWFSSTVKEVPLLRLFNPNVTIGTHHYTISTAERDNLVSLGWNAEGIGWYGINGSSTPINKTNLQQAINTANGLDMMKYTTASWATLQTALANANSVNSSNNVNQTQIDNATNQLNSAINGLVTVPDVVNKHNLMVVINQANGLVATDYTTDSWANLQTALTNANSILNNGNATQAQVDSATSNLQTVITNLVKATPAEPELSQEAYLQVLNTELLSLINQYRASNGLSQVAIDSMVQQGSDIRVREALTDYSHTRPNGDVSISAIPDYDTNFMDYLKISENLGRTYYGTKLTTENAKQAALTQINSWKASSIHNNALLKNYASGKAGIASAFLGNGLITVQLFI